MPAHAKLSASGAHRWMACPASVMMEADQPDTPSSFAAEGTAAHDLAEQCLRGGVNADAYLNETIGEFIAGQEMVDAVQIYLDYVRSLPGELFIEERVDFSPWVPGGFGTADAIVMNDGRVTVIDLKYGKGLRIDAENNPQGMLYAAGVYNEFSGLYTCDQFRIVIVQPRLDHISEWDVATDELIHWAATDVMDAAEDALSLNPAFRPSEKACQFCKAKAICKPLADHVFGIVSDGFEGIGSSLTLKQKSTLSNADIGQILPQLSVVSGWVSAIEAHAFAELNSGREIPGYKLVHGRSLRKWRDENAAEILLAAKLDPEDLFSRKLISPAQAEKLLGKDHEILAQHCVKPNGKPTLAPASDKRPAIEVDLTDGFSSTA